MIPSLMIAAMMTLPVSDFFAGRAPEGVSDLRRLAATFDYETLLDRGPQSSFPDPDFRAFHRVLARNLTSNFLHPDNLPVFFTGSAATVGVLPFRDDIRDAIEGEAPWLGNFGDKLGSPVTQNAAAGTLLLIAPFTDNARFRSFAFTAAQAKILDSTLKYAIKFSVTRSRPSGENENSFPSGHTSGTFMYARLIHHYYGTVPGVVAYGFASLVGISRIELGKHFVSDVVFGATLGVLAAQTALRGTSREFGAASFAFVPIVSARRRGAAVIVDF